jgi:hypothetical protein
MRVAAVLRVLFAALCTCTAYAQGDAFVPKEISAYPFKANGERESLIRSRYKELRAGMKLADVHAILGNPDEVRPAYDPNLRRARIVGHTYWYVIRRLVQHGSETEMRESLVRVRFSLDGTVESVVQWGIDGG